MAVTAGGPGFDRRGDRGTFLLSFCSLDPSLLRLPHLYLDVSFRIWRVLLRIHTNHPCRNGSQRFPACVDETWVVRQSHSRLTDPIANMSPNVLEGK